MVKERRPNVFSTFSGKVKNINAPHAWNVSSSKGRASRYEEEADEEGHTTFTQHRNTFSMGTGAFQRDEDDSCARKAMGRKDGKQRVRAGNEGGYLDNKDLEDSSGHSLRYPQHLPRNRHSVTHGPDRRAQEITNRTPSSMQRKLQSFQAQSRSQQIFASMNDEPDEDDLEMEEPTQEQMSPSPAAGRTPHSDGEPSRQATRTQIAPGGKVTFSASEAFETIQHNFVNGELDRIARLPVLKLPTQYQKLFSFTHFNKAQSVAFRDLYYSDKNVVVTAPTGAGKTVMFELAFLRMLDLNRDAKAVYLAPTKALCYERYNDWSERLAKIGCKVLLMTSDTDTRLSAAYACSLIVATPEKWDYLTRNNTFDKSRTLMLVRLLLIDEIHILREMKRGAVMEVLVSRMKALADDIRFVAVSATIPNAEDVAAWIGRREKEAEIIRGPTMDVIEGSAQLFTFSEEFRPCPLKRYVYGYRNPGKDQWSFDGELNNRLIGVLDSHLEDKAALIFCPTRKACNVAARALATQYRQHMENNTKAPWTPIRGRPESVDFEDTQLQELYACGIGYHHAGLCPEDRRAIEHCFLRGHLKILCCTSSLAVGVNLPAFLVIIRGTAIFDGRHWNDYKDLDVLQMIGRAGRPQFDTEGVCVIMTEQQHKNKWMDLVRGETVVESTLHYNLVEHINAEIYIRYGASVAAMQGWLAKTFFFMRLCKMPGHYKLPGCEEVEDVMEAIGITIRRIMTELAEHGLIEDFEEGNDRKSVVSSVFGGIMAKTGISFETMKELMKVKENTPMRSLIETISHAKEYDGIMLRSGEKDLYNSISTDGIPYPPDQINEIHDKISMILQAKLAGIDIDVLLKKQGQQLAINPRLDINIVMEHAPNVLRALLQTVVEKKYGSTAKDAMQLLRSVNGSAWEGTAAELRQIHGIGSVFMSSLKEAGIESIVALTKAKPERLTMLLSKTPDQAKKMINDAKRFPRFLLSVEETPRRAIAGKGVETDIKIVIDLEQNKTERKALMTKCNGKKSWKWGILIRTSVPENHVCQSLMGDMKGLIEAPATVDETLLLTDPNEEILVLVACLDVAGSVVESQTRTSWPAKKFPKVQRENDPSDSVDSDLDTMRIVTKKTPAKKAEKKVEPADIAKPVATSGSKKTGTLLREIQAMEAKATRYGSAESDEREMSSEEENKENEKIAKKAARSKPAKKIASPNKIQEQKPKVKKSYEERNKDKEDLEMGKQAMLAKIERANKKKREEAEESKRKKKQQAEEKTKAKSSSSNREMVRPKKAQTIDNESFEENASMDAFMVAAADAMERSETEQDESEASDTNIRRKNGEASDEEEREAARNRKKYGSGDWNFNVAEAKRKAAKQAAVGCETKSKKAKRNSGSEASTRSKTVSPVKETLYVTIDDSESEDQWEPGACTPSQAIAELDVEEDEPTDYPAEVAPIDQGASYDYFDQYVDYQDDVTPQDEAEDVQVYCEGSEYEPLAVQHESCPEINMESQKDGAEVDTMDMEVHATGYPCSSQLSAKQRKSRREQEDSGGLNLPDIDIDIPSMADGEDALEQLLFNFD